MIVSILRLASIYAILATGFVVVYRTSRVLNLAHPGVILLCSYSAIRLLTLGGGPSAAPGLSVGFIGGVLLICTVGVALSLAVYYAFIRPIATHARISVIMMTLAVLFLTEAVARFVWQGQTAFLAFPSRSTYWQAPLLGRVGLYDIATFVVAALCVGGVGLLYQRSRHGVAMRAVAENQGLSSYRGVNVDRIGAWSWGMSGLLAAVGALVLGMHGPVGPLVVPIVLAGFAVSLVAGLDSLAAIPIAALFVAATELLVVRWVGAQLADAIPFAILLLVLVIRPWGLAGTVEELNRV